MSVSMSSDLPPSLVFVISVWRVWMGGFPLGPNSPSRASSGVGGGAVLLQAREAHDALLADLPHEVEVDLLVGAGLRAELVATAAVLVPQDDAVLLALVHGAAGAGLHAHRLRAVVAEARHVEVVGVGGFARARGLVPVGPPLGLLAHGVEEDRLALAAVEHFVVVEVPAAAPLFAGRPPAGPGQAVAIAAAHRLVVAGMAAAGLGVDGAPPLVVRPLISRPQHLAGHGAGLAADALVQIEDHGHLVPGAV